MAGDGNAVAQELVIGVTGPARGIPWAWWATRWQLRRQRAVALRLFAGSGRLDKRVAGVIIGGGNDIDPGIYGGDVSSSPNIDRQRDDYELQVLSEADNRGLPVMGICRGAQLMNVHQGGSLIGDLAGHRLLTSNKGTLFPRKLVNIATQSTLAEWLGSTSLRVNSLHHQAIKETGKNLEVSARDRDGIIQAIENVAGPRRIGVQWHPEYLPQRREQRRLFASFVGACRDFQSQ